MIVLDEELNGQSAHILRRRCDVVVWPKTNGCRPTVLQCAFFSGRELAFTFATCHRDSVCLSVVCDVGAPYSGG